MKPLLSLVLLLAACGGKSFDKPIMLGGKSVDPQTLERGKDIFNRYCATCHGVDGKANTAQAAQLDPRPRDFTQAHFKHKLASGDGLPTDQELKNVVRNGVPATGMPGWPNLDPNDVEAVIQYVKTFSPRWQSAASGESQKSSPAAPEAGDKTIKAGQ